MFITCLSLHQLNAIDGCSQEHSNEITTFSRKMPMRTFLAAPTSKDDVEKYIKSHPDPASTGYCEAVKFKKSWNCLNTLGNDRRGPHGEDQHDGGDAVELGLWPPGF